MKTCSICGRSDLPAIDAALIRGASLRDIAAQYGTAPSTLQRHKQHVSRKTIEAHQRAEAARVRDLRREVRVLLERALGFLDRAEGSQDARDAGVAFRETREALKLALQVDGQLGPGGAQAVDVAQVDIQVDRERALALFAAEVNLMPERLKSMVIEYLRERRRQMLEQQTAQVRRDADSREPPPRFAASVPSRNGGSTSPVPLLQGDAGTGIRPDGDVALLPGDDHMVISGDVRTQALAYAQAVNWPHLLLTSGRRVAGEPNWRAFALDGSAADIAGALAALTVATCRLPGGPDPPD